jgi:hypothetical protein
VATVCHGAVCGYDVTPGIEKLTLMKGKPGVCAVTAHGIYRGGSAENLNGSVVDVDEHIQDSGLRVMVML